MSRATLIRRARDANPQAPRTGDHGRRNIERLRGGTEFPPAGRTPDRSLYGAAARGPGVARRLRAAKLRAWPEPASGLVEGLWFERSRRIGRSGPARQSDDASRRSDAAPVARERRRAARRVLPERAGPSQRQQEP